MILVKQVAHFFPVIICHSYVDCSLRFVISSLFRADEVSIRWIVITTAKTQQKNEDYLVLL